MRAWVANDWSVGVVSVAIVATPARADTYDVWTCGLPDGTATENAGWKPVRRSSARRGRNSCAQAGVLTLMFGFGADSE